MTTGNVTLVSTRIGKIPAKVSSSYLSADSNVYYPHYSSTPAPPNFGVELLFENLNKYPVQVRLTFSKHISRDKDGTYLKDSTPVESPIHIPAHEKVKRYVSLGEALAENKNDLRFQDVYIEEMCVSASNQIETKTNLRLQIYSKNDLSKVSTVSETTFGRRVFKSLFYLFLAFILIVPLINDSPYWLKPILVISILFLCYKTYQMWQIPYIDLRS